MPGVCRDWLSLLCDQAWPWVFPVRVGETLFRKLRSLAGSFEGRKAGKPNLGAIQPPKARQSQAHWP